MLLVIFKDNRNANRWRSLNYPEFPFLKPAKIVVRDTVKYPQINLKLIFKLTTPRTDCIKVPDFPDWNSSMKAPIKTRFTRVSVNFTQNFVMLNQESGVSRSLSCTLANGARIVWPIIQMKWILHNKNRFCGGQCPRTDRIRASDILYWNSGVKSHIKTRFRCGIVNFTQNFVMLKLERGA